MTLAARFLLALLATTTVPFVSGCGGAGVNSPATPIMGRGRLSVNVNWPKGSSRVIPTASKSMRIELWANGAKVTEQLLVAPAKTAVFETYPVGTVEARVTAYSEIDGTGTPVARGTGSGDFNANADDSIAVTLSSTTVMIEAYPSAHYGSPGDTSEYEVYADDADGAHVEQDPADTLAVSANPAVATVDTSGVVSMHTEGETTITLTDKNSGSTTELLVVVMTPDP